MDKSQTILEWREDTALVSDAVEASERAFASWSQTSLKDRIDLLSGFKAAFEKRVNQFEEAIVIETGKARWEARIEAQALIKKLELSLQTMLPLIQAIEKSCFIEGQQELSFEARGVCAVLGPFNFPMHLANGHIVPALLAGNTVIFKPSEFAPACASLYSQAVDEVGLPPGVFQMLPGGPKTGQKLVENSAVKGVFFTGSYKVGQIITESLLKTRNDLSTLSALEMGGKNALIVDKSADLQQSLGDSILSAFVTAGQRCSCTSRIFVPESKINEFENQFVAQAKRLAIGDPQLEETFMGPLIHQEAAATFLQNMKRVKDEGLIPILESKIIKEGSALLSPAVYRASDPERQVNKFGLQQEFFGPQVCLIPYTDREELLAWHEACPYGLVSSVYANKRELFDWYQKRLKVGLLNFNKPTVGASSSLPFGGLKKSGNNWPTAIFAYFYCSTPQGRLLGPVGFDKNRLPKPLQQTWEAST